MNAVSDIVPALPAQPYVIGEFRTSETLMALTASLAKASAEFDEVTRNKEVKVKTQQGEYKFKYATLDAIIAATFPALHKNGIVVIQMPVMAGNRLVLLSRLMHESGEFIESGLPLQGGNDPKALGSAITYARRYVLSALLGVAAEEDDDGGAASGHHTETVRERPAARRQPPPPVVPAPGRSAASIWEIVSRDGEAKSLPDADAWKREWTMRLGAVGKANKPAAEKRATLAAMDKVNADVFASLTEAGHAAAVQQVTAACKALDVELAEHERAGEVPA